MLEKWYVWDGVGNLSAEVKAIYVNKGILIDARKGFVYACQIQVIRHQYPSCVCIYTLGEQVESKRAKK